MERDTKEQVDIDKAMNELDKNLREGKMDQIDDQYFLEKNIFTDYKNQSLTNCIRSEYGPQIFVKRQKSNDSTIESFTYVNGFYIGGDDFSDKLIPYKLELSEIHLPLLQKNKIFVCRFRPPVFQSDNLRVSPFLITPSAVGIKFVIFAHSE